MIGFITGLLVGGVLGFSVGAILTVGSEEDDIMFDDEEIEERRYR